MIASPALTLASTSPLPGMQSVIDGGEGAEAADFAALLAQTVPAAKPGTTASPSVQSAETLPSDPALVPVQAATTGKILPPALPQALPDSEPVEPDPAAAEAQPSPEARSEQAALLALPHSIGRLQHRRAGTDCETAIEQPAEQEDAIGPELRDAAIAFALPAPMVPAAPLVPGSVQTRPDAAEPTSMAGARDQVRMQTSDKPPVLQLQIKSPEAAADRSAMHNPAAAGQNAPQPARVEPAPAAQPALQPLSQVRLEVAVPEPLRIQRGEAPRPPVSLAAMLVDETEPDQPALIPLSAPLTAPQNADPVAAIPSPSRPHDFAALVDRLVAAREAAQPQAVSVSLPHAEFGQVRLHFRNEDGALAVSLASTDPDFARIAAQAAPPVLPVGEARSPDANSGQQTLRGDGQNPAASQGGSPRGQSQERRGEPQTRFEQYPQNRTGPRKGSDRNDIFA